MSPRRRRGRAANESGLRALGADGARGRSAANGGRVANESGLRALGAQVERSGGRRRRRSGRPRWSRRRKVFAALGTAVALVVVLAGGVYLYGRYRYDQLPKVAVPSERPEVPGQPFNLLVIGSDSRVGTSGFGSSSVVTGQRSDVVMIWHVDPATHQIEVLSIPRDTMVSMVGSDVAQFGQFNRINAAYNSGPDLLVQTIEDNFGIPINHVVQVDFGGFEGAVNALGGIYLDFNYPAKDVYSGLDITHPGCQLLDGAQALAVARSRHYQYYEDGQWLYDGTSDLGRIQRQDAFLRALIKAAESKVNPLTVNAFIGSLPQGITIDKNLSYNEILGLAVAFHNFNPSALATETLSDTSDGYVSPWGDVLFVDQPAAQEQLVAMFGSELSTPTSPPPDTSLVATPPPEVTPTTAPPASSPSPASTTPTTTPPPSFDPSPC